MKTTDPCGSRVDTWEQFNQWNRRDRQMSRAWVLKLCRFIKARGWAPPSANVLDFGCGYFDVGFLLAPNVARMDGYDPFTPSVREVEREAAALPCTRLYTRVEDIPRKTYNLLVVNSVIQYMNNTGEFRTTLALMRDCLYPAPGSRIVISDIMPRTYTAVQDAAEILLYAFKTGLTLAMLTHLFKAARFSRKQAYLQLNFDDIRDMAAGLGLRTMQTDENLTPSRRRYTCLLEPA